MKGKNMNQTHLVLPALLLVATLGVSVSSTAADRSVSSSIANPKQQSIVDPLIANWQKSILLEKNSLTSAWQSEINISKGTQKDEYKITLYDAPKPNSYWRNRKPITISSTKIKNALHADRHFGHWGAGTLTLELQKDGRLESTFTRASDGSEIKFHYENPEQGLIPMVDSQEPFVTKWKGYFPVNKEEIEIKKNKKTGEYSVTLFGKTYPGKMVVDMIDEQAHPAMIVSNVDFGSSVNMDLGKKMGTNTLRLTIEDGRLRTEFKFADATVRNSSYNFKGSYTKSYYNLTGVLRRVKIDNTKDGGVRWKIGKHYLIGLSADDKKNAGKKVSVALEIKQSPTCYTCTEHKREIACVSTVYKVINMKSAPH